VVAAEEVGPALVAATVVAAEEVEAGWALVAATVVAAEEVGPARVAAEVAEEVD